MFKFVASKLFSQEKKYTWKPAIEIKDGRTAAALMTFCGN